MWHVDGSLVVGKKEVTRKMLTKGVFDDIWPIPTFTGRQ